MYKIVRKLYKEVYIEDTAGEAAPRAALLVWNQAAVAGEDAPLGCRAGDHRERDRKMKKKKIEWANVTKSCSLILFLQYEWRTLCCSVLFCCARPALPSLPTTGHRRQSIVFYKWTVSISTASTELRSYGALWIRMFVFHAPVLCVMWSKYVNDLCDLRSKWFVVFLLSKSLCCLLPV